MPLRLYSTLAKDIIPFAPRDPGHVTFYTCGPTVYDDAHIGNFRSFLAADLLRRFIESPLCDIAGAGAKARRVTHVMNITDVGHMTDDDQADGGGEDKMAVAGKRIAEAKKSGKLPPNVDINPADPYQVARFYADRFIEDAVRLGLKVAIESKNDPSLMPRATDSVPGMIRTVELLVSRGHAYVVGAPGSRVVYFDVRSFPDYGKLSGNTLDSLREGAGGRIDEANQSGKKHPADFLLWKEDSSHIMKWDSPWGAGYPGWHIECTAMSAARLAPEAIDSNRTLSTDQLAAIRILGGDCIIDLHSGGEDNIFPHHECEIAQSTCAFNAPFAQLWFHPRFLLVEGAKMSKSKGNFFTARDLFAKYEPAAIRLELIRTHYRSNANFTEQGLKDSDALLRKWLKHSDKIAFADDLGPIHGDHAWSALSIMASKSKDRFAAALHQDLNVAGAIAEINQLFRDTAALATDDKGDVIPKSDILGFDRTWKSVDLRFVGETLNQMLDVLGVKGMRLAHPTAKNTDLGVFIGCDPDPAVVAKLNERVDAKKSKDFARSDAIRNELAQMGYQIKDVAGGKVEVRKA